MPDIIITLGSKSSNFRIQDVEMGSNHESMLTLSIANFWVL